MWFHRTLLVGSALLHTSDVREGCFSLRTVVSFEFLVPLKHSEFHCSMIDREHCEQREIFGDHHHNVMVKFIWAEKAAFAIQKSMGSSFGWCSNWYRGKVAKELKKYGLRYDDLYDEMYDFDIMEALHRLPIQVQDLRNQRLKRAMDCGFKHNYLDREMQAKQTPYEFYLQDMLAQVSMERREREAQGSYMPYEREMP